MPHMPAFLLLRRISLTLIVLWGTMAPGEAQVIEPLAYWNFDQEAWQTDVLQGKAFRSQGRMELKDEQGILGNYLHLTRDSSDLLFFPVDAEEALTLEFFCRFPQFDYHPTRRLFYFSDYSVYTFISQEKLVFRTITLDARGEAHQHDLTIPFDGLGRKNFGYYHDNNWHHYVFKFDARTGKKEVWIDGAMPTGFSARVEAVGTICRGDEDPCRKTLFFSHSPFYKTNFSGDLDELVVFDRFVPTALHQRHFRQATEGRPLSFEVPLPDEYTGTPEGKGEITQENLLDEREFAPDFPEQSYEVLTQLNAFPLPRYKPQHQLMPNFNWMGMRFFAGRHLRYLPIRESIANSVEIQEALSRHWNYGLVIQNAMIARDERDLTDGFFGAWIDLANRRPGVPLGITTLWPQVKLTDIQERDYTPYILRRNLPDEYYLATPEKNQNDPNRSQLVKRSISPMAPANLFAIDGRAQKLYLQKILDRLERPVYLINENGEVPPLPYKPEVLEQDPRLRADKLRFDRGYEDTGGGTSAQRALKQDDASGWARYQAAQKTRLRKAYSDVFMEGLPQLRETLFSWYGVDGGPMQLHRFEWSEARKVGDKIRGQYYSTPDFYPRWPDNWRKWKGAWRGLDWVVASRKEEVASGDELFSPFVAAGWDREPTKNIRPSQWLGLLKLLGPMGAEFFYTGFFNEGVGSTAFAHPNHYTWQAVMPSYAQAISSRYEEILLDGRLLRDASGQPLPELASGDPRVPVSVRKQRDKDRYVIAATAQPNSNLKGAVPDSLLARVRFDGHELTFFARRQGSVFIYDLETYRSPVLYQLDSWHETGHPWWWSKDLLFEAENFDFGVHAVLNTEVPKQAEAGDYREFTTYVSGTQSFFSRRVARVQYAFEIQAKGPQRYKLAIRARSSSGKPTGLTAKLDRRELGSLNCISGKEWRWYEVTLCVQEPLVLRVEEGRKHLLELDFVNTALELDQVKLIRE